jgi:hypothetical protein
MEWRVPLGRRRLHHKVHEVVPERLAKNRASQRCEKNANAESKPPTPGPVSSYRLSCDTMHASPRIRDTSTMMRSELQTANEPLMT